MNEGQAPPRSKPSYRVPAALSSFFAGLASQVLIITGVLYYVGWLRIRTYYHYFNVDTSLLGFNTTDYVLGSVNIVFPALFFVAVAVIVALRIDYTISARSYRVQHMRAFLMALRLGAAIPTILALISIIIEATSGPFHTIWIPLSLLIACTLFLYSLRVADILRSRPVNALDARSLQYSIALFLAVVAILWALSVYAGIIGNRDAENLARNVATSPEVVLYTTERLAINGPGVNVAEIAETGSKYHFRYTGIKLLSRSGNRLFLIPAGWLKGRDSVYVLHDNDDLRADVTAP